MASVIDNSYTKTSSQRTFIDLLVVEGLGEIELLTAYGVLTQDTRKFIFLSSNLTEETVSIKTNWNSVHNHS